MKYTIEKIERIEEPPTPQGAAAPAPLGWDKVEAWVEPDYEDWICKQCRLEMRFAGISVYESWSYDLCIKCKLHLAGLGDHHQDDYMDFYDWENGEYESQAKAAEECQEWVSHVQALENQRRKATA